MNRRMKCKLLFCALLALTVPTLTFAELSTSPKGSVILVIRHGEQPDNGEGLSAEGKVRAQAYVRYFQNFVFEGRPLKLDEIFAAKDSSVSHRPRLTVEPTASALGLSIDDRYANKQYARLADDILGRLRGQNILICWHHGNIPQLLSALGADPDKLLPRGRWPSEEFGGLILLRYDENGKFIQGERIPEHLSTSDN